MKCELFPFVYEKLLRKLIERFPMQLRVLYEAFPMAMIMEKAGGAANTGMFKGSLKRILDIVPTGNFLSLL